MESMSGARQSGDGGGRYSESDSDGGQGEREDEDTIRTKRLLSKVGAGLSGVPPRGICG